MKKLSAIALITFLLMAIARADNSTNAPVKPYPLDHCVICGMLVKGRVDAYSFVYKGQEIKLCNKAEKEEFDRNPEKYMKKIAKEAAKLKQNSTN
jgi:YHS domain-containing protein